MIVNVDSNWGSNASHGYADFKGIFMVISIFNLKKKIIIFDRFKGYYLFMWFNFFEKLFGI